MVCRGGGGRGRWEEGERRGGGGEEGASWEAGQQRGAQRRERSWEKRIVEPVQLYRQSCSLEEADSGGWGFLSILGPSRK